MDSVRFLEGGREAFPRMLQAIERSRQSVDLEVYRFARDGVGDRFRQALSAASLRGVRVRVVVDGWGTALDGRWLRAMLQADGCEVRIHNPLVSLLAGRFRRDHRKVLVVDGEVAWLGGINIADEYGNVGPPRAPDEASAGADWLDAAVEIRGPVAAWIAARQRGIRLPAPPGPVRVWLSGRGGARPLRNRYRKVFGAARGEILVAHSYFLPDRRFVRSITAAARRGVRVRLLLAGRSDVPLARAGTVRLYRQLLAAGVEIREWIRSVHHAKVAVVDGGRLLLGSFNLDPYSLSNLEALVEVDEAAAAMAARRWAEGLLAEAQPVEPERDGPYAIRRRLTDAVGLAVARIAQWVARVLAIR
jgi:cardiolipin synthase A/B